MAENTVRIVPNGVTAMRKPVPEQAPGRHTVPSRPAPSVAADGPTRTEKGLLTLQNQAGNKAVSQLLGGNARQAVGASQTTDDVARSVGLVVQRHSDEALEEQVEAAEEQAHIMAIQRSVSAPAATVRPAPVHAVQRHVMPRNRRFRGSDTPKDENVAKAKQVIGDALPTIILELSTRFADKTPDPAKTKAMLSEKICEIDDAPDVGLNPPAAAQGQTFRLMVRSPYYYDEQGAPDEPFIRATLIHESLHSISFNHTGLQDVEFTTDKGEQSPISAAGALDSLDEAVTERLSREIYEKLYPQEDYKTNYWQGLRAVGVHMTTEGLKLAAEKSYQEKNWTGDIVELVKGAGLTEDELETIYLKGEGAPEAQGPLKKLKDNYGEVLRQWYAQKENAWKADLPKGVMPASAWVSTLNNALNVALSLGETQAEAMARVSHYSGGHELVAADDPRSHVYGAGETKRHKDDFEIFKEFYPDSKRDDPHVAGKDAPSWKGKRVGWSLGRYDANTIETKANELGKRLGLNDGGFPHIVIPGRDTLGSTPFKDYEVAVFNSNLQTDIKDKNMAEVSGVEGMAKAQQIIANQGGGAYETKGKVVYTNTTEERTLLHEIGHYKQDRAGLTEHVVNPKLLEYHNIVKWENPKDEVTKNLLIRLSYTGTPKVKKQSEWDSALAGVPDEDHPPEYLLLKKVVAKAEEQRALQEIEDEIADAKGSDAQPVYTKKMKWYLKRRLASEYFKASKFNQI